MRRTCVYIKEETMTDQELKLARFLASIWVLSAARSEDLEVTLAPSVLDSAMMELKESFPDWAASALHFSEGLSGPHCIELFGIISAAQAAGFAEIPNPRYMYLRFTLGKGLAEEFAKRGGLDSATAYQLGLKLRSKVAQRQTSLEDFQYA